MDKISTSIKKLINEGFVDNTIDSAANTLKEHKGKIALIGGVLAYHLNPDFHRIVKKITGDILIPLSEKSKTIRSLYGNSS